MIYQLWAMIALFYAYIILKFSVGVVLGLIIGILIERKFFKKIKGGSKK
jgi:cell shape-determining protein MreD